MALGRLEAGATGVWMGGMGLRRGRSGAMTGLVLVPASSGREGVKLDCALGADSPLAMNGMSPSCRICCQACRGGKLHDERVPMAISPQRRVLVQRLGEGCMIKEENYG